MKPILLVLFSIISQDEVFERHFHLDPLLIRECGPNVMGLGDSGFIRFQDHLSSVVVDMESSEDQDETGEGLKVQNAQLIYTGERVDGNEFKK